ncbi:MAG: enoyl-CoA hydratase-related protein [Deltaproteobacteria bacterium]|nr:enoyl-CoA hydratase-related protein [Deltaproteobacteria bacterium]
MPEIHLGLIPDCGGTTRLVRALGVPRAKEFVMLGDRVDAQTAARDGLLTALAGGDDPWTAAGPLIDKLAAMPPRALGLAKRAVDLTASVDEMTGFEIETLVQTGAVTAPDFPQILADGVQKLMAKKT